MIWLKACLRCQAGDTVLDKDMYGEYVRCLQCGYTVDLSDELDIRGLRRRPNNRAKEPAERDDPVSVA